jgi:hypothetical protein
MFRLASLLYALPVAALACGDPVCVVDPTGLGLQRIITFEDQTSHMGPGRLIDEPLHIEGAKFGERFAGQDLLSYGNHDVVSGQPEAPLQVVPGAKGQNLSIVYMRPTNVLNGYGSSGFPKRDAQGEGAIAVLFDNDQGVFAFQIRGGEAGTATVQFFARDGREIGRVKLDTVAEGAFGFMRNGPSDVAGFVLTNDDPQGLAIDNIAFDPPRHTS